jgi:hypothetical protein
MRCLQGGSSLMWKRQLCKLPGILFEMPFQSVEEDQSRRLWDRNGTQ